MNPVLTIDPEFEAKCPPLTEDELSQLEENILEEGLVLMPLIVWNDTIVDGHNRYRIAQAHPGIGFRTHEKQFNNRYEALSWICKNQLGRRNLTPMQKKYLVGERYDAEKKAHGASDGFRGNQHADLVSDQIGHLPDADNQKKSSKTRKKIASETGTSEGYVQRAEYYAKGVNAAEEVLPGIKNDLLLGKYKPRETDVAAVARAAPEERREKAEQLRVFPEKKERFMASFYDADEVNRLFEISKGTKLEIPILFGAFYGMRRSETLGMKWDAIDFERDTITIRHTLTTVALDGKRITVAEDRTKNKSSMRTLPLVPFVKERLLELKAEQEENRRLCGRSYVKDYTGYVCINEIGDIIKPNYVSCGFPKLLEEHGLRRVRYHDLRHSCASLLLANGVPMKQIQEWLGHSDFSTTANIYAHLEYSSKVISADAMLAGLGIGNRE